MRTHTKIMILIILTSFTFVGVFLGYQYIKVHQEKIFLKVNQETKAQAIDNILKFKAKNDLGPVNDYSCWDEMVSYIHNPSKKWEETNLTTLSSFGFSNAWIFDKDLNIVYSDNDSTVNKNKVKILKGMILEGFKSRGLCHFFLNENDTLLEITGGTIVPSSDINHTTTAQGYFIAASYWNKEHLKELESEIDFSISFRSPFDSLSNQKVDDTKITISKSFYDAFGNTALIADFTRKNRLIRDLASTNKLSYFLIGLLIITFVVFSIAIREWITHPLMLLAKSLESEKTLYLSKLKNKNNEFGEIATLIKKFYEQKCQLEMEISEHIVTQKTVIELYEKTVNLNHELQSSEEELRQNLDFTKEMNEALSRQQTEITDSISYAYRIQSALLPPIELIKQLDREFFILYKPRNIVSGDFYWINQSDSKAIIAIADCTGHGVPGGFMSMLGMAYLAEIVNQNEDCASGEILNQLRNRVIDSLHQSGKSGETSDGMDIALCIVDFEQLTLQFSGANNPVYIVRDNETKNEMPAHELIEIKGDRMPIGYSFRMDNPFTTHNLDLQKNDIIYLFTDGYQDQISNLTLLKFKLNKLRELIVDIHNKSLEEQKRMLNRLIKGHINHHYLRPSSCPNGWPPKLNSTGNKKMGT